MKRIDYLLETLTKARESYYGSSDEVVISDVEYDSLEQELRNLDPENDFFNQVGLKEKRFKEVNHTTPMLSMDKVQTKDALEKWFNKNYIKGDKLVVEPKIDGISGDLFYENGKFKLASTRGDGKQGYEIPTNNINCILPETKDKNFTGHVRGEFYISQAYKEDIPNLRNYCAGFLKRIEKTNEHAIISFVAYELISDYEFKNDIEKLEKLSELGFDVVEWKEYTDINQITAFYDEYLKKLRDAWRYETDGLIIAFTDKKKQLELDSQKVVKHHHHYNIAFKPPASGEWTELIDIDWNVSRNGMVVPTGILKEVKIGSAYFNRVTLNNIGYIRANDIQLNDKVNIIRSNDVIPKFIERKHTAASKEISISKCPCCHETLEMTKTHYMCNNIWCEDKKADQMLYWFKSCNIENVSIAIIKRIVSYKSMMRITDLYKNDLRQFFIKTLDINTNTDNMKRFFYTFEESKKQTEAEILDHYGIPYIGEHFLERFNISTLKDLLEYKKQKYLNHESKIVIKLCNWLQEESNVTGLQELIDVLKLIAVVPKVKGSKSFCITGAFSETREVIIGKLKSKFNWDFSKTVSKGLDFLLVAGDETSSKTEKAEKYGVPIIHCDFELDYNKLSEL
jgi:DNA ligase (NAD+)